MPKIVGTPLDLYGRHNFKIEIDGITRADAATVSGLEAVVSEIAYNRGGALQVKAPGRVTFPNITITRAHCYDNDLYDWFVSTANAAAGGTGLPASQVKRDLAIVQLGREGNEVARYSVFGAFPTSYKPGDLDGSADTDPVVEEVVLVIDYFTQEKLARE